VGSVTVQTGIGVLVNVTGVSATGQVGSPTFLTDAIFEVTGVAGQGQVGQLLVWGIVDDSQVPGWQNVDDSQAQTWVAVDDSNAATWTQVVT
jgi:hypothetical protein